MSARSSRVFLSPRPSEQRTARVDVAALRRELEAAVDGEVRFDSGSRALYASDASNYRQAPLGVVVPRTLDAVAKTVDLCRKYDAPIVPRGGGTSLTGSTCNFAVVLDFSKYCRRLEDVDRAGKTLWVETGAILDNVRDHADRLGLTFGPDPSTHEWCVIGGMVGNNSCGMHALQAGRVADNVHELDVVTYRGQRFTVGATSPEALDFYLRHGGPRGEIYGKLKALAERYAPLIRERYPKIPRRVSGYNLDYLLPENGFHVARALVGTEGTCVTVLRAKLRLVYSPPKRTLVAIGYGNIFEAADAVPEVLQFGPIALEALDEKLVGFVNHKGGEKAESLKLLPEGKGFLLVEFEGESRAESDGKANALLRSLLERGHRRSCLHRYDDERAEERLWEVRESGLGATAFVPGRPDTWPGWEDSAVPPDQLGAYLREFRKLLDAFGYDCSFYGHFGQGCLHCRIDFKLTSSKGLGEYRKFVEAASDLCERHGGSFSGEHGDGQARGELLPKMYGPELMRAFQEFKSIWDPDDRMNPGKVVSPREPVYRLDENLRLGTDYAPKVGKTHFAYPGDDGFAHAALRCVGVGKCRREGGGTMCPSYQELREEKHSTRGRTHLLFEMTRGDVIQEGWRSEAVHDALDLCLACKGCKGDCPVKTDVATYKAEFLSHYYRGRLRPRPAYAMGWIHRWARIAGRMPGVANLVFQTPGLKGFAQTLGGIATERRMPRFAAEPFTTWFHRQIPRHPDGPRVLLWADTFNNFLHPEVAKAAVRVLEDAGYRVEASPSELCCGRPLYDYGFLDLAKRLLRRTLRALAEPIRAGVPVVGLEPSCLAVFRDELTNLFPSDSDAKRLSRQSFVLAEFLRKEAQAYPIPKLATSGPAIVQGHCHQKALFGFEDEKAVLEALGLEVRQPEPGCCGLAGSFGFEAAHYDLSVRIGERHLGPAARKAGADTRIVADGFSCHTQIEHLSGKKAKHLAQLLAEAIEARDAGGR